MFSLTSGALLLLVLAHVGDTVTVVVDPSAGNDSLCMSAVEMVNKGTDNYHSPCATLNYAIRGNLSLDNTLTVENCTEDVTSNISDVVIVLRSGLHVLSEQLFLGGSRNITFQADAGSRPIITLNNASYSTVLLYESSALFMCEVDGLVFDGITFSGFGNSTANATSAVIYALNSPSAGFNLCTFQNNSCTSIKAQYYARNLSYFVIDNCEFTDNRANGHGGAISIELSSSNSSTVNITNSTFTGNHAELGGGGIYILYRDKSQNNKFHLNFLTFKRNCAGDCTAAAAGGAVSVNSSDHTYNNNFSIKTCTFTKNKASAGAGFSMALYDSNFMSSDNPDGIQFIDCKFTYNQASNEGTAVGLFSLVHVDQVGFPVDFSDCTFENNNSPADKDTSAVAAFRFPIGFNNNNTFSNNRGGGIMLLNTRMIVKGEMLFANNKATFGGGITMDDRCLLEVGPNVTMTFINNTASESGGAIYVEFPPIRFVIEIFNRLCFLQYHDDRTQDQPPQCWENVKIQFINNKAGLSGAAIYANDMQRCSWLSASDDHIIFKLPKTTKINRNCSSHSSSVELESKYYPFYFDNNILTVQANNNSVRDEDLATAPLNINPYTPQTIVQPGERIAITLNATDQLGNTREAIWALDVSGQQETILDALSANNDTYFYTIPPPSDESSDSCVPHNIQLKFSLLKTLGYSSSLYLTVYPCCHPGYKKTNGSSGSCVCNITNSNILRCDENNRYIYLREGIFGSYSYSNESGSKLVTARVLPGYTSCQRQGRLPGCQFKFENPCVKGRTGLLCGRCTENYAVTLDLQSCTHTDYCSIGIAVFILLSCFGVFFLCLLILWFNIPIPNELKGFIFYVQVIGLVYRPYSVVTTQTDVVRAISVIVNLLGFSNPLPLCIGNFSAQYVALFGYIPPLIILFSITIFAVGARFNRRLADHSALKGITTLSVFFYKYIADTSFVFLSCVKTDLGFVFQYDGTACSSADFIVFFVVALLIVIFFVVPLPFLTSYVCIKRPKHFQAYADVLTDGLQARHHWWGGWDIFRRLPFVMISFFVVLSRPSLILFFMSIAALVVMIVHVLTKPYENKYTNIIEAAILLDLLLVTGAFLDPSSEQVPEAFAYILIFLPYLFCIGYICWIIGKYIRKRYIIPHDSANNATASTKNIQSATETNSLGITATVNQQQSTYLSPDITIEDPAELIPPTTDTTNSGAKTNSSTTSVESRDRDIVLREPLLDDTYSN